MLFAVRPGKELGFTRVLRAEGNRFALCAQQSVMNIDLDQIFPIVDPPSAGLMKIKAQCLLAAGIITAAQKNAVDRRASELMSLPPAARRKAASIAIKLRGTRRGRA